MARIGFIQSQGVGDIIIALPIAAAFVREGHQVFWPVDRRFAAYLRDTAPYVDFIPLSDGLPSDYRYMLDEPEALLRERECEAIHVLYSRLNGRENRLQQPRLAEFLKFDEYKYAVTGVPFSEKWNLQLSRQPEREERLFRSLGITRDYICVHREATTVTASNVSLPAEWQRDYQIVEIGERSDSPFDWIATLERAAKLVCLDSLFANLVEQLNLPNEKYLLLRSRGLLTPVFRNGWRFLAT